MALLCSNCSREPVATDAKCFEDWCQRCNDSLWSTRDGDDDHVMHVDHPAYIAMLLETDSEVDTICRHEEWQGRGLAHCHIIWVIDVVCDDDV